MLSRESPRVPIFDNRPSVDQYLTLLRRLQAIEGFHQCRLACPTATYESNEFTGPKGQRHILKCQDGQPPPVHGADQATGIQAHVRLFQSVPFTLEAQAKRIGRNPERIFGTQGHTLRVRSHALVVKIGPLAAVQVDDEPLSIPLFHPRVPKGDSGVVQPDVRGVTKRLVPADEDLSLARPWHQEVRIISPWRWHRWVRFQIRAAEGAEALPWLG